MCNWVTIEGELFLEHMTSEGETIFVPENEVTNESEFISGFQSYTGAELLSNKPQ